MNLIVDLYAYRLDRIILSDSLDFFVFILSKTV